MDTSGVRDNFDEHLDLEDLSKQTQVSNLPGSFSTEELKWFEDAFETLINKNIDELEDLEARALRQMEEKK